MNCSLRHESFFGFQIDKEKKVETKILELNVLSIRRLKYSLSFYATKFLNRIEKFVAKL